MCSSLEEQGRGFHFVRVERVMVCAKPVEGSNVTAVGQAMMCLSRGTVMKSGIKSSIPSIV